MTEPPTTLPAPPDIADRNALNRWLAAVAGQGVPKAEALHGLQDEQPALAWTLLLALSELEGVEPALARHAAKAEAFLARPEVQAMERLWQAHAEGRPIDPADAAPARALRGADLSLLFLLRSPAHTVRKTPFRHLRLSPAFAPWLAGFLRKDEAWATYLEGATFPSPRGHETVTALEDYCGFQERILRDGDLTACDPFTGQMCPCLDSWQSFGRTCFMFRGSTVFYLMSGGSGSKAFCLYVPSRNLFLDFRAALGKLLGPQLMANTLAAMAARLARNAEGFNAAIGPETGGRGPRKVFVALQRAQNFAHHYWNFYTGLERIVLAGLADRVHKVIFSSTEFFGPLEALFPEFRGRIDFPDRVSSFDPCPFSRDAILVTVGGYAIPRTLLNRVRGAVEALPPPRPEAAQPAGALLGRPTLWLGLRLGDKSWISQERDAPRLIDRLHERFPDLLVLLDGFSFPLGKDQITAKWLGTLEELTRLAETIRAATRNPEGVVSLMGNTLRESVLWAARADAYVAPIGTSQHKIGWFTDAPGVIYMPSHGDAALARERLPGAWEAEGSALPVYLSGDAAGEGQRRNANDRRKNLGNIHLDVDALADRIEAMLRERPRRPAT